MENPQFSKIHIHCITVSRLQNHQILQNRINSTFIYNYSPSIEQCILQPFGCIIGLVLFVVITTAILSISNSLSS